MTASDKISNTLCLLWLTQVLNECEFYYQNNYAELHKVSTGLSKFCVTKPVSATPMPESSFTFWFSRLR